MLTALTIKNFTLVQALEIDFSNGMTAITGETGAGKSLILGALGLALGDRADTATIRRDTDRAEISALFDITGLSAASQWLEANDFECLDEECLLRRIVTREGRSRGSINGQPATMQQLRELGEMLIDIHSQHEHQSLLRKNTHRLLLDSYAGSTELAEEVKRRYRQWQQLAQRIEQLASKSDALAARRDLLQLQVEELNQLELKENELAELEQEQKLLANAETILQSSQAVVDLCSQGESFNLVSGLNKTLQLLETMPEKPAALEEATKLLDGARIDVEEASREIEHYLSNFEGDPQRLIFIEERLSAIYQLARKHRVNPELLPDKHRELEIELGQLTDGEENIDSLQTQLGELAADYRQRAEALSQHRQTAAEAMSEAINRHLQSLAMEGATLQVALTPLPAGELSPNGLETIELLMTTNPGEPPRPLSKIASGGELSRTSLAIQVVAAQKTTTPTLVFDEVDVGIGGATADVVGRMLRQLGESGQVICVTHQPQVAASGHQHFRASKQIQAERTESMLEQLSSQQRVDEIARMLGSAEVTELTRKHAEEMIDLAQR